MTSSTHRPRRTRLRLMVLAGLIVAAILAYSWVWLHMAGRLEDRAQAVVAELNRDGRRAACEQIEARGYPFRLGLFCRSTVYVDPPGGVAFRAGALRSAAQIYDIRHVVAELDGPATLELPGLMALDLSWESLRTSVRGERRRVPERLSMEIAGLAVEPSAGWAGDTPMLRAQHAEIHLRPVAEDLDLALRIAGLGVSPALLGEGRLGLLDGVADLTLTGGALRRDWSDGLRGVSGQLRNVAFTAGGDAAGFSLSGPFSVDAQGLVDADLRLSVTAPEALATLLGDLFPLSRREIMLGMAGVAAMGEGAGLPLAIRAGEVRLGGLLRLGDIPPL